jgi:hypothetical protein
MSAAKTDPEPVRREVGPSGAVVTRFTTAVHVGLVVALVLVTALHVLGIRVGAAADAAVVVLSVAVALLVCRPRNVPRS